MADYGKIRTEGEIAFWHKTPENPYPHGSSSAAAWNAGWRDGEDQALYDQRADERRIWNS